MGGVVLRAYHDLDAVAGAVLDPADADGVVVAHDAGPHDLRADIVVIRVADGLGPELYHGAEQALAELVGELVVLNGGKITLVGVHHDVNDAAGRLIGRKGVCELRIHDGEAGADAVVVAGGFDLERVVVQHAARGALAAGGGDGNNGADGHHDGRVLGAQEVIPHVAVIESADADALGGVDDAAAADGEQEVDALALDDLDALAHVLHAGVGLSAAEVNGGDALVLDVLADAVKEPAADHAAAAVDYEDLGRALLGAELADILLLVLAEHELGGAVESEVVHLLTSIFYILPFWPLFLPIQ